MKRSRHSTRRIAQAALVAACGALALSAPALGGTSAKPKTRTVKVGSDYYNPDKVTTLRKGDRMKWVWESSGFALHNVVVKKGPQRFHSPLQAAGVYTKVLTKPGKYLLYCTEHTMQMTVTVKQ
jgi:plastocyanin